MRGNLVPDGTYIKQSAVPECLMKLRGPAHVFNNMDDANNALLNHEIKAGEIVTIRYLGPKASYDSATGSPPNSRVATFIPRWL